MTDSLHEGSHQPSFPLSLPKYRLVIYGGIAVILGPVTLWFLRRLLPGQPILLSLKDIDFSPLLTAFILLIISWTARILRVWCLLRPLADSAAARVVIKSYLAGVFISHVTPSAVGGYPVFLFLLHQQGVPAGRSLAVGLIDSVNTGLILGLLITAGVLLFRVDVSAAKNWVSTAVIGTIILIVPALALLIFAGRISQVTSELSQKNRGGSQKIAHLAARAAREVQRFEAAIEVFWRDHRPLLLMNLCLNLLYWVSFLSITPLLLRAVGARAPWPAIIGCHIATEFAQYLIPTPGAAGGVEATMALLIRNLLSHEQLVTFLALWRIYTYYISLFATSLTIPWVMNVLRKNQ
ncbi:MAG: flippase-like domain-containing protein [Firmicutes bacterium]|nr:flippase-like domain-containing protein [Bacillota bacterium]